MDAFVITAPEPRDMAVPHLTARFESLRQYGFEQHPQAMGGLPSATSGRAGWAADGPWRAIGLTTLTNTAHLRVLTERPDAGPLDIVARLRATHGATFHEELSGGFAVLLFNSMSGAIECYRDHFGVIPLYYCIHDGALTCSTDIRAALHISGLPIEANLERVADYVVGQDIDPTITAFRGLYRLAAGHQLLWQDGKVDMSAYWTATHPAPASRDGAPDALRARLATATQECLDGQVAPGAMLSGGLDSSTLTGLAAEAQEAAGKPPLPALSFVYCDGDPQDESTYIDAANAAFRTAPHKIPVTAPPRLTEMSPLIEEQMDLFLGFGLPKSRQIYEVAAKQGVTALIDGHGGDEVISHGYSRLFELAAQRRCWRLLIEMLGTADIYGSRVWGPYLLYIARHSGLADRSILRRILLRIAQMMLPKAAEMEEQVSGKGIMSPALRTQVDPNTRYQDDPGPTTHEDKLEAERIAHLQILRDPRMESAFEILHRSAVRQGVLPLYPFFDRAVVDLCLSLPSDTKLRNGQTRWVLREAMRGELPESIRTRATKAAFDQE
ncbi:MAG: asparagine synthase-related protein, partial [Pseudomonadota bacterium]